MNCKGHGRLESGRGPLTPSVSMLSDSQSSRSLKMKLVNAFVAPGPGISQIGGKRSLDPQAHPNYGQHDRYADGPLIRVVVDQAYDDCCDDQEGAQDPRHALRTARLAHPSLLLTVRQAKAWLEGSSVSTSGEFGKRC